MLIIMFMFCNVFMIICFVYFFCFFLFKLLLIWFYIVVDVIHIDLDLIIIYIIIIVFCFFFVVVLVQLLLNIYFCQKALIIFVCIFKTIINISFCCFIIQSIHKYLFLPKGTDFVDYFCCLFIQLLLLLSCI